MVTVPANRKTSNMKTYSRRVNEPADEPPSKKRRLGETSIEEPTPVPQFKKSSIMNFFKPVPPKILLPSSSPPPQSPLPSSDAAEPTSTPPSSPPPAISSPPPQSKVAKKRRLKTRPILQPIENGSVKVEKPKERETNNKLSQMRLDLGQQVYEECSTCHYYYDRSDPTDRKAHDKFHDFHTNNLQPSTSDPKVVLWEKNIEDKHHSIRAICRTSSMALKEGFVEAFNATYQDMGGEGMDVLDLWSEIRNPHGGKDDEGKVMRYKGYMYLIDRHPVSILLVERTKSAIFFPFKESEEGEGEGRGKSQGECKMSIDRIWTRTSHRRKGYATRLVDMARENFIQGLRLGKRDVAFTSTTRDGGRFAKRYCEGLFEGAEYLMTLS